ncbi:hypothetical protein D3C81_1869470 [compost metagenome]
MLGAQQFVRSVVFHHGDFQAVEVLKVMGLSASHMGQDNNGEIQVGSGEGQVVLALGGGHDAGQQVELALFDLVQHLGPTDRLHGRNLDGQTIAHDVDVVRRQALVAALLVTKLEWRPRRVDAQA